MGNSLGVRSRRRWCTIRWPAMASAGSTMESIARPLARPADGDLRFIGLDAAATLGRAGSDAAADSLAVVGGAVGAIYRPRSETPFDRRQINRQTVCSATCQTEIPTDTMVTL